MNITGCAGIIHVIVGNIKKIFPVCVYRGSEEERGYQKDYYKALIL